MPRDAIKEKSKTRGSQPYTGGLGKSFTTPPRKQSRQKSKTYVAPLGLEDERDALLARLEQLKARASRTKTRKLVALETIHEHADDNPFDSQANCDTPQHLEDEGTAAIPGPLAGNLAQDGYPESSVLPFTQDEIPDQPEHRPKKRRLLPNAAAHHLYNRWMTVLPGLVGSLSTYIARTVGIPDKGILGEKTFRSSCSRGGNCQTNTTSVLCLFFDCFQNLEFTSCECQGILELLILNGLFPTSPSRPRVAVAIHFLDFYEALFEKSYDAINATTAALNLFYSRRGFVLLNSKGLPIQDAFRRGFSQAVQWYDSLKRQLQVSVECAIQRADQAIQPVKLEQNEPGDLHGETNTPTLAGDPSECSGILQDRCPACFGGGSFGRSFKDGGDIHVALDGNFNHRHLRTAGECPDFYQPEYFLSKEQVDQVGHKINTLRKLPKRVSHKLQVPDTAVDECEDGHTAGKGHTVKTNMEKFDAGGLMGMVCRHDIPLFIANIDTPGEQQKYPISLLEHLFTLLPANANVVVLYDVSCVLDRSVQLYGLLPANVVERVSFATSAMHAYVHQWACQLVYNPRLQIGLGLSDGEGLERLWSRLTGLIAITRSSSKSKRIWLIDRHAGFIARELRNDLGHWIKRRSKKGVQAQGDAADKILKECEVMLEELEKEWELQRSAQLSLRAHAPVRLKKELDTVLSLQAELEGVDQAIEGTRAALATGEGPSSTTNHILAGLEALQTGLKDKVEALYASLNVQDSFPELKGVDLDFVRTLIMARDLKINIRKRAIGSFFEWDRLDQAAGGRDQPLGTKLHQSTRKAIKKRTPALMTAIRKFNKYCETLANLHREEWNLPLPDALPTKLADLRTCTHLMEDVWITRETKHVPRWLEETEVREGIRAMLKKKRCYEESQRLCMEADNLCRWYGRRLAAVEWALATASDDNNDLEVLLRQERLNLLNLKDSWSAPLAGTPQINSRFDTTHISLRPEQQNAHQLVSAVVVDEIDVSEEPADMDGNNEQPLAQPPQNPSVEEILVRDLLEDQDPHADPSEAQGPAEMVPYEPDICWSLPDNYCVDTSLLHELQNRFLDTEIPAAKRRSYTSQGGKPLRIDFEEREFRIMSTPTAWLNDVCVNGLAFILKEHFSGEDKFLESAGRCALFDTFTLPKIRYNATDNEFWRHTKNTMYWSKDIWILPIHRTQPSQHWVLAIVRPSSGEVLVFDSFAHRRPWKREIREILQLVGRLIPLAKQMGSPLPTEFKGRWKVHPLSTEVKQHNGYDCGLWVLAMIFAILRGFHCTGLDQSEMPSFRRVLCNLVRLLPSN